MSVGYRGHRKTYSADINDRSLDDGENLEEEFGGVTGGATDPDFELQKRTIEALLQSGASRHAVDKRGRNAVHLCTMNINEKLLAHVIDLGVDVHKKDYAENSPLHNLLSSFSEEERRTVLRIAKVLVQAGVDVNAKNCEGKTLLHLCTEKGNVNIGPFIGEVVTELGADPTIEDATGVSPLFLAVQYQQHGSGIMALINYPTSQGNPAWQYTDKKGDTILHYAARNRGGIPCGKEILALGLSIDVTNKKGVTPLHTAAQLGNLTAAQHLISLGANINVGDCKGNTPLHYAVTQSKHPRLAQLLIDSGGDLHAQNQKGKSTLQLMSPKVKQYLGL